VKTALQSYYEPHGKNEHEKGISDEEVLQMAVSLHVI
jgi:hypothetical protein